MLPNIFIGSSSEGRDALGALQRLLPEDLAGQVVVQPWTHAFELSSGTMESLEKAADEADFAVLILTADDEIKLRSEEKLAPRDNVTFELGLFIGRLGRDRCYIVQEKNSMLHLPTDLRGITSVPFTLVDKNWDHALGYASSRIAKRVSDLRCRTKLTPEFVATQRAASAFSGRIAGYWWERIIVPKETPWLSFFRIEFDPLHNSVRLLEGRGYESGGRHGSNWDSRVARLTPEEEQIDYHWKGWYLHTRSNEEFHGFGSMKFEALSAGAGTYTRARGKFWDVDESHPKNTQVKPVEMRRVTKDELETMTTGPEKAISELVVKTLAAW